MYRAYDLGHSGVVGEVDALQRGRRIDGHDGEIGRALEQRASAAASTLTSRDSIRCTSGCVTHETTPNAASSSGETHATHQKKGPRMGLSHAKPALRDYVNSQPVRYARLSSASEFGTLVIFMFAPS